VQEIQQRARVQIHDYAHVSVEPKRLLCANKNLEPSPSLPSQVSEKSAFASPKHLETYTHHLDGHWRAAATQIHSLEYLRKSAFAHQVEQLISLGEQRNRPSAQNQLTARRIRVPMLRRQTRRTAEARGRGNLRVKLLQPQRALAYQANPNPTLALLAVRLARQSQSGPQRPTLGTENLHLKPRVLIRYLFQQNLFYIYMTVAWTALDLYRLFRGCSSQ